MDSNSKLKQRVSLRPLVTRSQFYNVEEFCFQYMCAKFLSLQNYQILSWNVWILQNFFFKHRFFLKSQGLKIASNSGNVGVGELNWRHCQYPLWRFQSIQLWAGNPPIRCLMLGCKSPNLSPFSLWPSFIFIRKCYKYILAN